MPKTDGSHESETPEWEKVIQPLILIGSMALVFLIMYWLGLLQDNIFTAEQKRQALEHPCLISDNGKVAIISSSWCANMKSNTTSEIELHKDLGYTITGVDSKNFEIYMER